VQGLNGAQVISCDRHDTGYDYKQMRVNLSIRDRILFRTQQKSKAVFRRLGMVGNSLNKVTRKFFALLGMPVDQTLGSALAQIQVIARKKLSRPDA